ncbi:MAG: DNA-binding response regulator [Candidatus Jettenia sp.]|uniref:Two-component response regulator n=1 Tax=Candidatus Jettenia caeni TaxID=247490 RepID=I3IJ49_9BACT|nr:response regulator [Candidatus Jettenia sp. AMX1]MBC6927477.1 DNA-binding response regulator [Candidatus Jettenia sp.]NUN22006.1 response regulator [Candidatus Jettenia caeni]KAA0249764.1 MAG: response regulator [Candidatus Jettenia sp. AMX1]MCE7879160.1 DNA-binding response regulator [Candidatus Jettenia sp. AMX1]MCQ3925721.1 DNA-binding response regulator [Candidatus Jettenia sp.]
MPKEKILIVDDEQDLVKLIRYHLEKDGYKVLSASNGEDALFMARRERPELIVLDLMLPGIDGLEVCKKLKTTPELATIAIVMLTAKGEESDITVGLRLGADDYITKPFSPKELIARIQAVLRRIKTSLVTRDYIEIGDLAIDVYKHEVSIQGESIPLTLTEFKLLHQLANKPGRVFTREQLLDVVSGSEITVIDRTIDVHIASLRKKLKSFANFIVTIRGIGYKFKEY